MQRRHLIVLVIALTLLAAVSALFAPPLVQPLKYHQFADQRPFFGISNAWNVLSNLAFLCAGSAGMIAVLRNSVQVNPSERRMYLVFFLGLVLTALGSAYYHLAPDNARLFWDRLPMTVAFASLVAATIEDRVDAKLARGMFPALLLASLACVLWWRWSEAQGEENMLPYVVVQAYAVLSLVALALLARSRNGLGNQLVVVIVLYLLAKGAEHFDQGVMSVTGVVSGHTIKHLIAALGGYWVLFMLRRRKLL